MDLSSLIGPISKVQAKEITDTLTPVYSHINAEEVLFFFQGGYLLKGVHINDETVYEVLDNQSFEYLEKEREEMYKQLSEDPDSRAAAEAAYEEAKENGF